MTLWQSGLGVAPPLIMAMAVFLYWKRAISRNALILAVVVVAAITALMLSM